MTQHQALAPATPRRTDKRRRAITTIRDKSRTVCPVTPKTRYRDRASARDALDSCRWQRQADLALAGTTARTEARIYQCPEPACHGGFHLTSIRAWRAA